MAPSTNTIYIDTAAFSDLKLLLGREIESLVSLLIAQSDQTLSAIGQLDVGSLNFNTEINARKISESLDLLHLLKGSAMSMHCSELIKQCAGLSEVLKSNDSVAFSDLKSSFIDCVTHTCDEIRRLTQD